MAIKHLLCLLCLLLALPPPPASAHYRWGVVTSGQKDTKLQVVFEERPRAGDGKYLDPFIKRGETWIRSRGDKEAKPMEMQQLKHDGKRWLQADVNGTTAAVAGSQGKWGVYRYGKTDVLLYYYAKWLRLGGESTSETVRARQHALDIVPDRQGKTVRLKVLWKGQPAAGQPLYLYGPGGFKQRAKTDDQGGVSFTPPSSGRYLARTYYDLPGESGEFEGKKYQKVRHNATLMLSLSVDR